MSSNGINGVFGVLSERQSFHRPVAMAGMFSA